MCYSRFRLISEKQWFSAFFCVALIVACVGTLCGQESGIPKLTLPQIEGLITHGVPDSTLGTQIQRRGISFVPTPAILAYLRVEGAGPLTIAAIRSFGAGIPAETGSGTAGAGVGSSTSDTGFDYPWYVALIQRKVSQNWYTQEVDPRTPFGSEVSITFIIARDGTPSDIRIEHASSSPTLDFSALRAMQRVNKFSPLPSGYHQNIIMVEYTFTYKQPSRTSINVISPSGDAGGNIVTANRGSNHSAEAIVSEDPIIPYEEMAKRWVAGDTPHYPAIARAARISGTVTLLATISETGTIKELRVISGPPMLQQSAVDAVKTWKYEPYLINGNPVEVQTTIHVTFSL